MRWPKPLMKLRASLIATSSYSVVGRPLLRGASFDELIAIQNEDEAWRFSVDSAGHSGHAAEPEIHHLSGARQNSRWRCWHRGRGRRPGHLLLKRQTIELAIGIGPFVVGPAVERKMGTAAFTALAIDAATWYDAQWAKEQGLYAQVFDDAVHGRSH